MLPNDLSSIEDLMGAKRGTHFKGMIFQKGRFQGAMTPDEAASPHGGSFE
jgi:hypothetical protein